MRFTLGECATGRRRSSCKTSGRITYVFPMVQEGNVSPESTQYSRDLASSFESIPKRERGLSSSETTAITPSNSINA